MLWKVVDIVLDCLSCSKTKQELMWCLSELGSIVSMPAVLPSPPRYPLTHYKSIHPIETSQPIFFSPQKPLFSAYPLFSLSHRHRFEDHP